MGPKWAKIIYRLGDGGYGRRSDNNIKNHFHMMVKRAIRELNVFVVGYNSRMRESLLVGVNSNSNNKKVYVYEKTYSI